MQWQKTAILPRDNAERAIAQEHAAQGMTQPHKTPHHKTPQNTTPQNTTQPHNMQHATRTRTHITTSPQHNAHT
jgi:hypothetical protein